MKPKEQNTQSTNDLSRFKDLALEEACDVLRAYMFQRRQITFLEEAVALYYDPISDRVFLEDEQLNVAMKDENGDLKQWATCRVCGIEGFKDAHEPKFVDEALCMQCCVRDE
ncbi:hypothetical protein HUU05_10135 [candidate division KSB1 bacterium]|nr:hypothetical protein [candidate division KSB1 bacterium]